MSKNQRNVSLVLVVLMLFALALPALAKDDLNRAQWCEGVTIRFFAGGTEGDAFAGIVYRGALAAERDLGANVEYVFSGWNSELMTQQLREAVAQAPDGIAMMGHPGNEAIMPLAAEAAEAGIIMMYQIVDVDQVRALRRRICRRAVGVTRSGFGRGSAPSIRFGRGRQSDRTGKSGAARTRLARIGGLGSAGRSWRGGHPCRYAADLGSRPQSGHSRNGSGYHQQPGC